RPTIETAPRPGLGRRTPERERPVAPRLELDNRAAIRLLVAAPPHRHKLSRGNRAAPPVHASTLRGKAAPPVDTVQASSDFSRLNSRSSHDRARLQSLLTVRGETSRASAICASLSPPKK